MKLKLCRKCGNRLLGILLCILLASSVSMAEPENSSVSYEKTVAQWKSYRDVADWLKDNFVYDMSKLRTKGLNPQSPTDTFKLKKGVCYDAAGFAIDALNRINPGYKAKSVFIKKRLGQPHHWVAAFTENGKLYIMDYGASMRWSRMNGIHGPYESLADYEGFLSSLNIPRFILEYVEYRDL